MATLTIILERIIIDLGDCSERLKYTCGSNCVVAGAGPQPLKDYIYNYISIYLSIYQSIYKYTYICIYVYTKIIYVYIYSLRKSNNYSLKSAQNKSVIILWAEDDAKQLYLVLDCWSEGMKL